ncbi:MAG: hypothetical protein AMJ55_10005 [Gammaproteobacteria bacterium SG8_15]|nr:MAG: hypothetical protein AMJ55_10005 [Gammaproteobacteria bacterium SG8_15]
MTYLHHKPVVILFLVSLLAMFLSFNFNIFQAVNSDKFDNYQYNSESLVIGRLVKSRKDGVFSSEGRMGRYMGFEGDHHLNQTKLFVGDLTGGDYEEYDSQVGIQGILLSQLDVVLEKIGFKPIARLAIYHGIVSLLFALVLSTIIVILYFDIGVEASYFLLLTIVYSKWQVYIGNNLYWMMFAMFLPMVVVMIAYKMEEMGFNVKTLWVSLLVMFFVFLKGAMGYEFISTVLVSMLVPLVYFSVKNSWTMRKLLSRCVVIGLFGLLGFAVAFLLHIYQLTLATDSAEQALSVIQGRITANTYYEHELQANLPSFELEKVYIFFEVIKEYFLRGGGSYRLKIPYLVWVLVFLYITIKVYRDKYELSELKKSNPTVNALIIATWFSILAPLSWFILAMNHSHIHTNINIVLWHLPFMIFGFALLGYILRSRIQRLRVRIATILE